MNTVGSLPIPQNATSVPTYSILSDGKEISQSVKVKALSVVQEFNRIPFAELTLIDGDPATQVFKVSESEVFLPGKKISISLGYGGKNTLIFEGLVVEHNLSFRTGGRSNLELCIQDPSVALAQNTKSRYFINASDSDIISNIVAEYQVQGLSVDVPNLSPILPETVQYHTSDWDFIISRAELYSLLCKVENGQLIFAHPKLAEEPIAELVFGNNMINCDFQLNAREQFAGVQVRAWDQENQRTDIFEAAPPDLVEPGNLPGEELAKVLGELTFEMIHSGDVRTEELQQWADGRLFRLRLGKTRGSVKCKGFSGLQAGGTIRIAGISKHLDGLHIATGVRHEYLAGGWYTYVQIGLDHRPHGAIHSIHASAAAGMVAGVPGLQIGQVTRLAGDPEGKDRILVRIPVINDQEEGSWARIATLGAGNNRGFVFRPEIGDEVVVGFLHGDPRDPIIVGALHSSANGAPLPITDDNHQKGYTSRSAMKLSFDDQKRSIQLETKKGNKIELNESKGHILLEDQYGNKVQMNAEGVTIESIGDLQINANGTVNVLGNDVSLSAQNNFSASGNGGASLNSVGITEITGLPVNIN